MSSEDPNTFTQKDLMQHLLHATQHAATREELQSVKQEIVADIDKRHEQIDKRFEQVDKRFEQVDKRFEQVDKRFEQVDKRFEQVERRFEQVDRRFDELKMDIKEQGKRYDRLSWAIFAAMLAIFFKEHITKLFS